MRIHSATWPKDELRKSAETDDLRIPPFREDARHSNVDLVRRDRRPALCPRLQRTKLSLVRGRVAAKGRANHCRRRYEASHVRAGHREINDLIDDAYRAKYKGSPYLSPMLRKNARSATVKVTPRETEP